MKGFRYKEACWFKLCFKDTEDLMQGKDMTIYLIFPCWNRLHCGMSKRRKLVHPETVASLLLQAANYCCICPSQRLVIRYIQLY